MAALVVVGAEANSEGRTELTFYEFLERMKHPSAQDLVRRIRSFMVGFLGKDPEPDRDGRSVQEFYRAIEAQLVSHPLWEGASAEELEASGEGLEKYLMVKLFPRAFAPLQNERDRDGQLSLRLSALQQFLLPLHLDIPHHLQNEASWLLAGKELQRMGSFKAPRDKLQCILNCCRTINNLLLNASISHAATGAAAGGQPNPDAVRPPGADDFLPVLIYVTVKANPPDLVSNLLYIQRYRNETRLAGEASYFYTNLVSAVSFLESLTASQLSIDPGEFESRMAAGLLQAKREQEGGVQAPPDAPSGAQGPTPEGDKVGKKGEGGRVREAAVSVESMQQRAEVVEEVLLADASGELARQFRFLYATEGDLRVGDVKELLRGYKDLALRYYALCRAVHGVQLVLNRPAGRESAVESGSVSGGPEEDASATPLHRAPAAGSVPAAGWGPVGSCQPVSKSVAG